MLNGEVHKCIKPENHSSIKTRMSAKSLDYQNAHKFTMLKLSVVHDDEIFNF